MPPPTAIIGLGNPYMSDEGIGVRVVAEIERRGILPEHVDVLDMGTAGIAVLHELEGRGKVIFVDCAFMDEAPGVLRRFSPEEAASRKVQTRLSLHEGDLMHTLRLAKKLGQYPDEVVIFGIQPESTDQGSDLSPALADRMAEYVEAVLDEVKA